MEKSTLLAPSINQQSENRAAIDDYDVQGFGAPGPEGRFASFLLDMEKDLAWWTGYTMTGLTLTRKEDHWLLVLKAHKSQLAKVAFFTGDQPVDTFRQLWLAITKRAVDWKVDRFWGKS